jgi:hypothetical protein
LDLRTPVNPTSVALVVLSVAAVVPSYPLLLAVMPVTVSGLGAMFANISPARRPLSGIRQFLGKSTKKIGRFFPQTAIH